MATMIMISDVGAGTVSQAASPTQQESEQHLLTISYELCFASDEKINGSNKESLSNPARLYFASGMLKIS